MRHCVVGTILVSTVLAGGTRPRNVTCKVYALTLAGFYTDTWQVTHGVSIGHFGRKPW